MSPESWAKREARGKRIWATTALPEWACDQLQEMSELQQLSKSELLATVIVAALQQRRPVLRRGVVKR